MSDSGVSRIAGGRGFGFQTKEEALSRLEDGMALVPFLTSIQVLYQLQTDALPQNGANTATCHGYL